MTSRRQSTKASVKTKETAAAEVIEHPHRVGADITTTRSKIPNKVYLKELAQLQFGAPDGLQGRAAEMTECALLE